MIDDCRHLDTSKVPRRVGKTSLLLVNKLQSLWSQSWGAYKSFDKKKSLFLYIPYLLREVALSKEVVSLNPRLQVKFL